MTKPASSSGMAHPGSIPSSHAMNGRRQRAGFWSERAAIAENEKSIGTQGFQKHSDQKKITLQSLPNRAGLLPRSIRPARSPKPDPN
jgi:hypothetical protein